MSDITLEQALDFANYRTTLSNKTAEIKARTLAALTVSKNGGVFRINHDLINFLKYLSDLGKARAVLLDLNENPVQVDVAEFLEEITHIYLETTNQYHAEIQSVRRKRSVKSILDL